MRKVKAENMIEIKEDVKIGNVILEKGDKIEVLAEEYGTSHILSIGVVNFRTGKNRLIDNIYDTWEDGGHMFCQFWINDETGRTVGIFGSGNQPRNTSCEFLNDRNNRFIFSGRFIDSEPIANLHDLKTYGNSIKAYVYK